MRETRFIVDSHGEVEINTQTNPNRPSAILQLDGDAVAPLGRTALTVGQIGDAKYFTEPGGRLINTETGDILAHGDGRINAIDISTIDQAIKRYENPNK